MRDYVASSATTTSTRRLVQYVATMIDNTKTTDSFALANATASTINFKDGLLGSKRARVSIVNVRAHFERSRKVAGRFDGTKRGKFQAIPVGCETEGTKVTRLSSGDVNFCLLPKWLLTIVLTSLYRPRNVSFSPAIETPAAGKSLDRGATQVA